MSPNRTRSISVQDSVYSALRESIISLNLAPGTIISEQEISGRFNVSRTPVREAFIHLAGQGLVTVVPQKETVVSLIDFNRVEQEFFLRYSLETAVMGPFLEKCTNDHLTELERLLDLQTRAFKKNSLAEYIQYDDAFHKVFFEGAGRIFGWEIICGMCGHYYRASMLIIRISGISNERILQHRNILNALKNREPAKTGEILYKHLDIKTEEALLRKNFGSYFIRESRNRFNVDFGGMPPL